jgi:Family of unknown function (DUF6502)
VRSKIQDALLSALEAILRPTVKLLLQCGIGYSEFAAVAKSVFIQVATDDYKRRGRPANFSQVSAMTGISRKEVSRIRNAETDVRWTPNMETSPVNTVLHQWHFDEDFSEGAGTANKLSFEGPLSFSDLVSRHAGDIPPGAMRATLQRAGVLTQNPEGLLCVSQSFFYSRVFDRDFIRGIAFSLSNLGATLIHNAAVHQRTDIPNERKRELGRLERTAWSEHLNDEGIARFKAWVDESAPRFLRESNTLIGELEPPKRSWTQDRPRSVGVSVYYFEED